MTRRWSDKSLSPEELARRLRAARERLGLTKLAVERRIGMGRSVLVTYESGRTVLPIPALMDLAALYGVSAGSFLDPVVTERGADEQILAALAGQPGLRALMVQMIEDPAIYTTVRDWVETVERLRQSE